MPRLCGRRTLEIPGGGGCSSFRAEPNCFGVSHLPFALCKPVLFNFGVQPSRTSTFGASTTHGEQLQALRHGRFAPPPPRPSSGPDPAPCPPRSVSHSHAGAGQGLKLGFVLFFVFYTHTHTDTPTHPPLHPCGGGGRRRHFHFRKGHVFSRKPDAVEGVDKRAGREVAAP